jgi:hypothetical protein
VFSRFSLIVALVSLASVTAWAQSDAPISPGAFAGKRVALVIGNSKYESLGTLGNALNDAREINRALSDLGFATNLLLNTNEQTLRRAIRRFSVRSESATLALVFYAGHGAQVAGENYLIPVDMDVPNREADIQISAIRVDDLISSIKSNVKIVFLDACRDNPILFKSLSKGRGGSYSRGLAAMQGASANIDQTGGGIFVAYATDAGSIAEDGTRGHSPFSEALLRHIRKPISIDDMFSLVTRDVRQATNNTQRPYKYASMERIICLPLSCKSAPGDSAVRKSAPMEADLSDPAMTAFQVALAGNDREELQRIASKFPNSEAAALAHAAIERMTTMLPEEWVLSGWTGKDKAELLFFYRPSSVRFGNGRTWADILQTTADPLRAKKFTNTSVYDCANKKMGFSRGSSFDEKGNEVVGPMFGDPRVVDLSMDVTEGSINSSFAGLICPPSNPGRILSQQDVKSDNWKLLATYENDKSLFLLNDSIEVNAREVRAIVKMESKTPISDEFLTWDTLVQRVVTRCDLGDFAGADGDFIGSTGHLVSKLFPQNRMKWQSPVKTSPLDIMVKTLCLSAQ